MERYLILPCLRRSLAESYPSDVKELRQWIAHRAGAVVRRTRVSSDDPHLQTLVSGDVMRELATTVEDDAGQMRLPALHAAFWRPGSSVDRFSPRLTRREILTGSSSVLDATAACINCMTDKDMFVWFCAVVRRAAKQSLFKERSDSGWLRIRRRIQYITSKEETFRRSRIGGTTWIHNASFDPAGENGIDARVLSEKESLSALDEAWRNLNQLGSQDRGWHTTNPIAGNFHVVDSRLLEQLLVESHSVIALNTLASALWEHRKALVRLDRPSGFCDRRILPSVRFGYPIAILKSKVENAVRNAVSKTVASYSPRQLRKDSGNKAAWVAVVLEFSLREFGLGMTDFERFKSKRELLCSLLTESELEENLKQHCNAVDHLVSESKARYDRDGSGCLIV